jgi:hypothetical protein
MTERHAHGPGTTELLQELLADAPEPLPGEPEPKIRLKDLLERFQRRSFGVFLLIVVLPSFIPVAVGIGGVSGVLSILCGLQMMLGLEKPWVPKFASDFGLPRRRIAGFARRTETWFRWLEKLIKPRQPRFTGRSADIFTGLIIVLMGIALFLPIPFTNFVFAIPLGVLAFALIERDGTTIALCWLTSVVILVTMVLGFWYLGEAFVDWFRALF